MQSFGVFGKPCNLHPEKHIFGICTANSCKTRVLCLECKEHHDKSHFSHIQSFLESIAFDIDAEFLKKKKLSDELLNISKSEIEKLDHFLNNLRKVFDDLLTDVRDQVISKLRLAVPSYTDSLESIKENLRQKKEECFHTNSGTLDGMAHLREQYAELYVDFFKRKTLIEKLRYKPPRLANLLDENREKLVEQMNDALELFKSNMEKTLNIQFVPGDEIPFIGPHDVKFEKAVNCATKPTDRAIKFIETHHFLALGDQVGLVTLYEGDTFKPIASCHVEENEKIRVLEHSYKRDDSIICGTNNGIKVISITRGPNLEVTHKLRVDKGKVSQLALSDDKNVLFAGGGQSDIEAYNLHNFKLLATMKNNQKAKLAGMVSLPKKQLLAALFTSGNINLYNSANGTIENVIKTASNGTWKNSLSYLPDREWILAYVGDNKLRAWKADKKIEHVKDFRLPENAIGCTLNRGKEVLFAAKNNLVYLMEVENGHVEPKIASEGISQIKNFVVIPSRRRIVTLSKANAMFEVYNY